MVLFIIRISFRQLIKPNNAHWFYWQPSYSKIKYKFGCDLNEELEFLHGFSDYKKAEDDIRFSRDDRKKMEELNLNIDNFSLENLKKQYKKLAKMCHPDLHPEDKNAEEKFKRLTSAYKKLLEKLS